MKTVPIGVALAAAIMAGCNQMEVPVQAAKTFGEDVAFLERHTDAFVLSGPGQESQLVLVPAYQGRVMTSTAGGPAGSSYGWPPGLSRPTFRPRSSWSPTRPATASRTRALAPGRGRRGCCRSGSSACLSLHPRPPS